MSKLGATSIQVAGPTSAVNFHRINPKRKPGKTQWLSFGFYTMDVYEKNPGAHLWIKLDGMDGAETALLGRGIAIGKVHGCTGVIPERFAKPNEHPGACTPLDIQDWAVYTVKISVGDMAIRYSVTNALTGERVVQTVHMPDQLQDSPLSNIDIGMAFNPVPASFALMNIRYG